MPMFRWSVCEMREPLVPLDTIQWISFNTDMSIACDALILLSDVFLSVLPL